MLQIRHWIMVLRFLWSQLCQVAPFLITRPGDSHAPHDPIQDSSPSGGHATHPPWEHTRPWGQIQVALRAWLVVRVLPAEDIGTGCYSNRAASPVTYSHWRHMHCRIQPGLSRWLSCHPSVQAEIGQSLSGSLGSAWAIKCRWHSWCGDGQVAAGQGWWLYSGWEYRPIHETVRGKLQELKEDISKTMRQQQRLAGGFAA